MPNQATTDEQSTAAIEAQETDNTSPGVENTGQLDVIPEKFVGKSALEIIQAYNNLEKSFSKSTSERSQEREKREALEDRIRAIESRPQPQAQYVQQSQTDKQPDPFETYEEEFEANPKKAIRDVVARTRESLIAENRRNQIEADRIEAATYHARKKSENPEYAKLEPEMSRLATEFQDLARPDKLNSKKMLELLHLAARGANSEAIASEAVRRAKEEQTSVKQEKRQAFSESAGSKGDSSKRFEDMSLDEMEKYLAKVR